MGGFPPGGLLPFGNQPIGFNLEQPSPPAHPLSVTADRPDQKTQSFPHRQSPQPAIQIGSLETVDGNDDLN